MPLSVAAAERVIQVAAALIVVIVVPAGIPAPDTTIPTASVLVEVRLATTVLAIVVVPVTEPAEKASGTTEPLDVAIAKRVICVAESIDLIVVPAGIPAPVTSMPMASPAVAGRLVTVACPTVVVPVFEGIGCVCVTAPLPPRIPVVIETIGAEIAARLRASSSRSPIDMAAVAVT